MQLQPRKINALIKQEMRGQNIKPPRFEPEGCRDYREERKVPTGRAAVRAGAGKYYGEPPARFAELRPGEVHISLNSHIGAPAVPVVSVGDRVELGQLIAQPPPDTLGVRYHASIAGTVNEAGDKITIQR